jgi:hypothetical protein
MVLLYFDGFESGPGNFPPEMTTTGLNASIATAPRTGSYALMLNGSSSASIVIPASAKVTWGSAVNWSASNAASYWVSFWGDGGTVQHLSLTLDATNHLVLRLGSITGTPLVTSTATLPNSQWRYLEVQATIADSGGRCTVRIDGVTIIDYTGDTKNGGTGTNIDRITLGGQTSSSPTWIWDDMYILDGVDDTANTGRKDNDFLGDIKVEPLLPNGDGAVSQWLGSDGNSVQNYLLVDEVPPNTTDYVGTPTVGNRDLWALADVTATAQTVLGVRATLHAAKSDAGAAGMKIALRESSGTLTLDADMPLSTTWLSYWGPVRRTKPSGGAWTPAEVNALQLGVEKT